MADLNRVFLMGRLTADPELRRTAGGTAVTELRLATTRSWAGRDGERREETLFISVAVWDRQAENCCQFLRKGSPIHVEGSLKMDTWDDKTTGEKRTKILVHSDRVQFLDSRRSDSPGGPGSSADDDSGASQLAPRRAVGPRLARRPGPASGSGDVAGTGAGFNPASAPAARRPRLRKWHRGRHPVLNEDFHGQDDRHQRPPQARAHTATAKSGQPRSAEKKAAAPAGPPRQPGVERRKNHPNRAKHGHIELILTQAIPKLGQSGDLVKVRPGFAATTWFPRGWRPLPLLTTSA